MREIKFRSFLFGRLTHWGYMSKGVFRGIPDGGTTSSMEEVLSLTQQFTGLKDRNGKEIYEGDIIDCHRDGDSEYTVRVEISDIRGLPRELGGSNLNYRIIVGNIYENPELLDEVDV